MIDVKVKFNAGSLIRSLRSYSDSLENRMQEFTYRLAEEGALVASKFFYRTTYADGEGVRMTVEPVIGSNGYAVCANGEAVGFLEFGAGDYTMTYHPFAPDVPFDVAPASWSSSSAGSKQYWKNGYWFFGKKKYVGIPAHAGLLEAWKTMQDKIEEIAKEVFG